LRILLNFYNS